jgi:hypothetical protein
MKAYWGSGSIAPCILDLGTKLRWVVSITSRPHYPRERVPGTHWIGGWVVPRAVLEAVVKRKFPRPRRKSNPRTPIVQLVAQRYTDWAIPAPIYMQVLKKHATVWYARHYGMSSGEIKNWQNWVQGCREFAAEQTLRAVQDGVQRGGACVLTLKHFSKPIVLWECKTDSEEI